MANALLIAASLLLATTLLPATSEAIQITQGTLIHCGFGGPCPVDLGSNAPARDSHVVAAAKKRPGVR